MLAIATELRDVLASISLCAQLSLHKRGLPASATKKMLETIAEEGQRGLRLIQQALDLSPGATMHTRSVNLVALMQGLLPCLSHSLPQSVGLRTAMTNQPCPVRADAARIHQILISLVIHARDAMPEGGEMRITLERVTVEPADAPPPPEIPPGRWARLTVSDAGAEGSEKVAERLFEPWHAATDCETRTGLGLLQVSRIVRWHRGFMSVDEERAEGRTVSIYLPLLEGEDRAESH